jgi:hypothetical protein
LDLSSLILAKAFEGRHLTIAVGPDLKLTNKLYPAGLFVGFLSTVNEEKTLNPPENKERSIQMKIRIRNSSHGLLLISLLLLCFALLPRAQAVITDPDETFPNFNTAAGLEALLNLTTGISNTAYGARALRANTTGGSNLGIGGFALINNIDGNSNTAVGNNSMFNNLHGDNNMALGQGALAGNVSGNSNVAMGSQALAGTTTSNNVGVGFQAGANNTSGSPLTAVGFHAAFSNSNGIENVAVGSDALVDNTTGDFNTAVGNQALANVNGNDHNVGVGEEAGDNITTGGSNICLGAHSASAVTTASNVIAIGTSLPAANVSNSCFIDNIASFTQAVGGAGIKVVTVNTANDRLGSAFVAFDVFGGNFNVISSRRFKDEIKPLDKGSEVIYALKPVSFRYKADKDPTRTLRAGLIAEDVQKVDPDLVVRDEEGKPEALHLDSITGMLLNEFLKEHKKVEEQQASIAELKSTVALQQKEMQVLTVQLKEQAAQIQRVSAQIKLNKAAPRTAANK